MTYDYYSAEYEKGLELYSSGVLIMNKCADLLPDHFSFVKGMVDSEDLSLNISREMLQHDRQLNRIAKNINRRIKSELERLLKNDREKYEKFYEALDRKSTRLNSSHVAISYAVFCSKKKKKTCDNAYT